MGEYLSTLIVLAVVVEITTNGIKGIFPGLRDRWSKITSTLLGIIICFLTNTGILSHLGVAMASKVLDYIVTGLLISKGSNALHDFTTILRRNAR